MTESLAATGAPLVYMAAAIALFLSIKAIPRVRLSSRGHVLAIVALGLAWAGVLLELGAGDLPPLGGAFVAGAVGGGLLAARTGLAAPPARLAWIPALAGVAMLLSASWAGSPGEVTVVRKAAALAANVLGAVGAVFGVGLAVRGSPATQATASSAMVVALVGWSAALLGFSLSNLMLLVGGGVLGAAGIAFARIIAASTGRSLARALFGRETPDPFGYTNVRASGVEEAAAVLDTARVVVIVPGFGMAAAHAQHPAKELAELLGKRGVDVRYAVHPAAGVVPGHMNIALDEANEAHDRVLDPEEARKLLATQTDVALVVGAGDVVNSDASRDAKSPLFGLDAFDLAAARSVLVIKRSLRPGAAGVKNALYERPNTLMLLGDAKRVLQSLLVELKSGGH